MLQLPLSGCRPACQKHENSLSAKCRGHNLLCMSGWKKCYRIQPYSQLQRAPKWEKKKPPACGGCGCVFSGVSPPKNACTKFKSALRPHTIPYLLAPHLLDTSPPL